MSEQNIKVGMGLLLLKGDQVLLGKRKGSHGEGEYAVIGGHLDYMESFEDGILRELAEECGAHVKVANLRQICVINLRSYHPKHFVDIGFAADWVSGEPRIMEPDKFESLGWFDTNDLPSPIFVADPLYIEALKTGRSYFDCP